MGSFRVPVVKMPLGVKEHRAVCGGGINTPEDAENFVKGAGRFAGFDDCGEAQHYEVAGPAVATPLERMDRMPADLMKFRK